MESTSNENGTKATSTTPLNLTASCYAAPPALKQRYIQLGGDVFDPRRNWQDFFPWANHTLHKLEFGLLLTALEQRPATSPPPNLDAIRGPSYYRGVRWGGGG